VVPVVTDTNLVAFLKRSQRALRKGGAIGVEENVCEDGEDGVPEKRLDPLDSLYRLHYLKGLKTSF